jgi:hypothetical protein
LILLAAACQGGALAQTTSDPLGPVRCYEIADAAQLAGDSAIQLCAGALSDAPGRCYAGAIDRFHGLSTQEVLQLCHGATSLEPLSCFAHLDATHELTEDQMIEYCTTACPLGPPPSEVASPACLEVAMHRTGLALQSAGELCAASRSAGPAFCYVDGQKLHGVAESKLVALCTEANRCQYYNAAPPP